MLLGDKLLSLRKEKNITQETVAEIIGVTRQTISNWELNQTAPDLEQAKKISELYNISLDELIENNNKQEIEKNSKSDLSNTEKLAGFLLTLLKVFLIFVVSIVVIGTIITILGLVSYKSISENKNVKVIESIENVNN